MTKLRVPDQPAAERIINPSKAALTGCFVGAFEDWGHVLSKCPNQTGGLSTTARANFIHDRAVHRLAQVWASETCPEGFRLEKIKRLWVVVLQDSLALKVKKLTKSLKSRNIPTDQTLQFNGQHSLLSDTPAVTNATSGYVLDKAQAEVVQLVVVCWSEGEMIWKVPLTDTASVPAALPLEIAAEEMPRTKVASRAKTITRAGDSD